MSLEVHKPVNGSVKTEESTTIVVVVKYICLFTNAQREREKSSNGT